MTRTECARHPGRSAERSCEICGGEFCMFCTTRPSGTKTIELCPACGPAGRLVRTKARGSVGGLVDELKTAFAYPFVDGGWVALVAGALLGGLAMFVLRFGMFMIYLVVPLFLAIVGYVWTWLLQVVAATADGEDTLPEWPGFTSIGDSALRALVLFLLAAMCTVPAVVVWATGFHSTTLLLAALLVGCAYFPMGMLALAMTESVAALNPLIVVPSIFRVGRGYLLAIAALVGVMVVRLGVEKVLAGFPIVSGLLLGAASLYFLVVQARVVGLLFRVYERDLGWFDRS